MEAGQRPFLRSLEGIRAYAFLMVFAIHFSGFNWNLTGRSLEARPWLILLQLSFVAVPLFFALSGYLITGILFNTKDRAGYFKVFYFRRAIRIFPLYYAIVGFGMLLAVANGARLHLAHLLFFFYLNNWSPDQSLIIWSKYIHVSHLWSLAVEEQFYLLWPIVIWILRGRRQILGFCYSAVAVIFVLRLLFPLLPLTAFQAYQSTLFRADAIMLGAALALHERGPMQSLARLTKPAWLTLVFGIVVLSTRALLKGQALPTDRFGIAVVMPLLSVMGAATVVLAILPGNAISYLCERSWAVALGKLSYSLYLLHELLVPVWHIKAAPIFYARFGPILGRASGMIIAFGLIYTASRVTYRFLEAPGMSLKTLVQYGGKRRLQVQQGGLAFLEKITS